MINKIFWKNKKILITGHTGFKGRWLTIILKVLFKPQRYQLIQLAMSVYILQYFLVTYTWSVFTFSHGLIPAFIALFFINLNMNENDTIDLEQTK